MGKKVIGCDVDSTIYGFCENFVKVINELTGEENTYEEWISWDYWHRKYPADVCHKAFSIALDPEKVWYRELYPGVKEIINNIKKHYKVVFITHNRYPDNIKDSVTSWLRCHFGNDVGVCVLHDSIPKIKILENLDAVGIIDDKPETLKDAANAGLLAATLLHPWNRDLVESRNDIVGFEHWCEARDLFGEYNNEC